MVEKSSGTRNGGGGSSSCGGVLPMLSQTRCRLLLLGIVCGVGGIIGLSLSSTAINGNNPLLVIGMKDSKFATSDAKVVFPWRGPKDPTDDTPMVLTTTTAKGGSLGREGSKAGNGKLPRVSYLVVDHDVLGVAAASHRAVDSIGHASCCEDYDDIYWRRKQLWESKGCEPISDWQTKSFPTCNAIHELPVDSSFSKLLGMSYHKIAWLLREERSHNNKNTDTNNNNSNGTWTSVETVETVFRTQRFHQEGQFDKLKTPELLEENRLEALATERLTSSSRTVDQYAFCGYSFIGEIGKGNLQAYVTTNRTRVSNQRRLEVGYEAAMMLSELHSIDYPRAERPTMTHGDFSISNILEAPDGRLLMIDFSEGLALRYSKENSNRTCRVSNRLAPNGMQPISKPPERYHSKWITYDKVDVFGLGFVLAQLLLGKKNPFRLKQNDKQELTKPRVLRISKELYQSRDVTVVALLYASLACLATNPEQRPTAYRISQGLKTALDWIRNGKTKCSVDEVMALFSEDKGIFAKMKVK